jgi:flagellar motor switch protein FliN
MNELDSPTSDHDRLALAGTVSDNIVSLDELPRVSARVERIERLIRRIGDPATLVRQLFPGVPILVGSTDLTIRLAGQNRPGVIAHLAWPRLDARVGFAFETPIAHAIVDHMLGFERLPAEMHRQVTPVEFGIMTFLLARALDRLDAKPGPLGPWDFTIDRVGTDPFSDRDLGEIVTWRWSIQIGNTKGAARLWFPEAILNRISPEAKQSRSVRPGLLPLASIWRAEAGTITLSKGISRLKQGAVLPIDDGALTGTVASPRGPLALVCRQDQVVSKIDIEVIANSSGSRVKVCSSIHHEPQNRNPIAVNPSANPQTSNANPSAEIPVTLVVELGRVSLSLSRLADLKNGDILELGRHTREPVEITSNGKLVARGELVQIDTELGVRITNVLL